MEGYIWVHLTDLSNSERSIPFDTDAAARLEQTRTLYLTEIESSGLANVEVKTAFVKVL